MRRGMRGTLTSLAVGVALAVTALPGAAQELADFDYENLSFRGVSLEYGYIWPSRVEPTHAFGGRIDLGYLGPGVRILPHAQYWWSRFQPGEVRELEDRVEELIVEQGGAPADVDLGEIWWHDLQLGMDGQVVWRVPYGILTFAGLGGSLHILNGRGDAIEGTFVEDLLDSVTAGVNLHGGVEYPLTERIRIYGQGRYEVLGDLHYGRLGTGLQFMLGGPAPGEERTR